MHVWFAELADYSDVKVIRILNSELADTLGNLLSRCTGTALNPDQVFPEIELTAFQDVASEDVTKKLIEAVNTLPGKRKVFKGTPVNTLDK